MFRRLTPRLLSLVAAVALVSTAGLPRPAGASAPGRPGTPDTAARHVVAATYNVDFGADLAPLFAITDPTQLVAAAHAAYQDMIDSNYAERAAAIAELLAKERPDVAGLQEADTWETGNLANPTAGFVMTYNFRALLLADLAADGVPYTETVVNQTFQSALPIDASTVVRFTDYNVILTRSGTPARKVSTSNPAQGKYTARIPLGAPLNLSITRGWASVDIAVRGRTFRFFTTHLEAYSGGGLPPDYFRNLQAKELAAMVVASPIPVVVTGDINSQPTCSGVNTVAYATLTATGLSEIWPAVHKKDPCGGFTSGQKTLLWPTSTLDHRIDDIFFAPSKMDAIQAEVIGDHQRDRTPSGLWPSDHAGSVGTLRMTKGW
jgi:endonuclease/exonuclease/phosphatase family metal-dependent hydrolase